VGQKVNKRLLKAVFLFINLRLSEDNFSLVNRASLRELYCDIKVGEVEDTLIFHE
jgi:hypothetical protein